MVESKWIFIINLFNNYVLESRQGLGSWSFKNLKSNLIKPWNFLPQPSPPPVDLIGTQPTQNGQFSSYVQYTDHFIYSVCKEYCTHWINWCQSRMRFKCSPLPAFAESADSDAATGAAEEAATGPDFTWASLLCSELTLDSLPMNCKPQEGHSNVSAIEWLFDNYYM